MTLGAEALPFSTRYDASQDPATSIDPLGTVPSADRLADALLPGLTARMWRPRLLTLTALAAYVADIVSEDRADERLEVRLALERMYVASIARAEATDPATVGRAARRVTGIGMARAAREQKEPLTRANFLKGQVVNGPIGVMARLSRALGLVTDDMRCASPGRSLLEEWADDEDLPGLLADSGNGAGGTWMDRVVGYAERHESWPGPGALLWKLLFDNLRADAIGKRERREIVSRLDTDPVRRRALEVVTQSADTYRAAAARTADRGQIERELLLQGVLPMLGDDDLDRRLRVVALAIDAHEQVAGQLQRAFDGIVWFLTRRHGIASRAELLGDRTMRAHLKASRDTLSASTPTLHAAIDGLRTVPGSALESVALTLEPLYGDALVTLASNEALLDAVLARHARVQEAKDKSPWIVVDPTMTLMPGFGFDADEPPPDVDGFLHPFRLLNSVWFLRDLGRISIRELDA